MTFLERFGGLAAPATLACVALAALSGCSLAFSPSNYQGGERRGDGGTTDAQVADARASDARPDADPCDGDGPCTRSFAPSYVADAELLTAGTVRVTIASGESATWNVDTGELDHGSGDAETILPTVQAQEGGAPDLAVFSVKSFEIEEDASLTLVGTRAVAVLSAEGVVIDGELDVSGDGVAGGPGGESATDADQSPAAHSGRRGTGMPGYFGPNLVSAAGSGGGGGSNATAGASSGTAIANTNGVIASAPGANPGALPGADTFHGGGAGGGVEKSGNFPNYVNGGGGGGALLLASAGAVRIGATGVIDAGGAGADAPDAVPAVLVAGPGGGAGGTILLESPIVRILGGVFANGGGGGGADTDAAQRAQAGEDGKRGTGAAQGSRAVGSTTSRACTGGGQGAAGTTPMAAPSDVATASSFSEAVASTGGGGGGGGRIVIRTLTAANKIGGTISPSSAQTFRVEELEVLD